VEMKAAGSEGSDLPSDPSIDLESQGNGPGSGIGAQSDAVVRSHRNIGAHDKRGPNVDIFVALVCGWYGCEICDLLAPIDGINIEFVIVNPNFVIRVSGGDGDLDGSGEEGGGGDIEGVDGGVLEDETRLSGLQDSPHQEEYHQYDKVEDQQTCTSAPDHPPPPVLVVATVLFIRHLSGAGE